MDPQDPPTDDRISELEEQLAERDQALVTLRRRQTLDRALREAGAVDVECAMVLVESMMNDAAASPDDLTAHVALLKERKPFLFAAARSSASQSGSQAPRHTPSRASHVEDAATAAQGTGRRQDLLRYLRLKRQRTRG